MIKTKKEIKEGAFTRGFKVGYEDCRKDVSERIRELLSDETCGLWHMEQLELEIKRE